MTAANLPGLAWGRHRGGPGHLGGSHLICARALGARLDLELNSLSADEPIKVERGVEAAAMEEVLLLVLGGDEAEAAVGDDLLDGKIVVMKTSNVSRTGEQSARSVRKGVDHAKPLLAATTWSVAQMFDSRGPRRATGRMAVMPGRSWIRPAVRSRQPGQRSCARPDNRTPVLLLA